MMFVSAILIIPYLAALGRLAIGAPCRAVGERFINTMDKATAKRLVPGDGVATPRFQVMRVPVIHSCRAWPSRSW